MFWNIHLTKDDARHGCVVKLSSFNSSAFPFVSLFPFLSPLNLHLDRLFGFNQLEIEWFTLRNLVMTDFERKKRMNRAYQVATRKTINDLNLDWITTTELVKKYCLLFNDFSCCLALVLVSQFHWRCHQSMWIHLNDQVFISQLS